MILEIHPDKIEFLPWDSEKNVPARRLILAKAYRRPDKVGHLHLPAEWAQDRTGTLWEVVKSSLGSEQVLGKRLHQGDIVKVRGHEFPTGSGYQDIRDGRYLVFIDAETVYQVVQDTWSTQEEEV